MRTLILLAPLLIAFVIACDDGPDLVFPTFLSSPTPTVDGTPGETVASPSAAPAPETVTLVFTNSAGEQVELEAEIADEPDERGRGLMNRESMPEDAGMIFAYDDDHLGAFYMKDTLIPLSIAFVLADGTIIDIQDMEPLSLETHRPGQAYRHAIEANQGWFGRNGIAAGDVVEIPETIAG